MINAKNKHNLNKKKRILLCYTELLHYRLDILKAIATRYDLTIVHSGRNMTQNNMGFRELVLPKCSVWRFSYQLGLLSLVRNERFDAVIFFFDLGWLSIVVSFLLCPRVTRKITWGLWLTKLPLANLVRLRVSRFADANIFYSAGAANDFLRLGTPMEKIHIARNTIAVDNPGRNENSVRNCILFVGTFNSRKQNDMTVLAFSNAAKNIPNYIRLVFVGDGMEKDKIIALAKNQECYDRIEFHHKETENKILRFYYDRAICSVSFGQAGLSILQSFGYGVPFITSKYAISGGEIENIIDGYNGILCEGDKKSLQQAIENLCCNKIYAAKLGRNALDYYNKRASVDMMLSGFISAIEGSKSS